MIRIVDEKCSGKTKKLIEAAQATRGTIASKSAYSTRVKGVAYGFYGIEYIDYYDLIQRIKNGEDISNVYIDELEEFVNCLLENNLAGYTMSKED